MNSIQTHLYVINFTFLYPLMKQLHTNTYFSIIFSFAKITEYYTGKMNSIIILYKKSISHIRKDDVNM